MQSGLSAALRWTMTGAAAAGLAWYMFFMSSRLWAGDLAVAVGGLAFALVGVVFWFWPFLASYYLYGPLFGRQVLATRKGGAVYGALWHTTAHCMLGGAWDAVLVVPIVVGALWGSWLPAAYGTATGSERAE